MKNKIYGVNFILIFPLAIATVLYMLFDYTWIKAVASLIFVFIGLINVLLTNFEKNQLKFKVIILIALIFACLGDIVLEINFIIGALLFAVGHIFFFCSFSSLVKFKLKDLLSGIIIFFCILILILFVPIFVFENIIMEILCIVYAFIISMMLSKAISNYIQLKNKQNLLILLGSVLFAFSDLMLLFNIFSILNIMIFDYSLFGILCLTTYYTAEFLLAHSIIYNVNAGENNNSNLDSNSDKFK